MSLNRNFDLNQFDRDQLFEALNHFLVCTFSSTWGEKYSIAKTEDRYRVVNELIDKLFIPVLDRLDGSYLYLKDDNGGSDRIIERANWTMADDPEVTDEHRRAHF